jgi:hypothetical protein
MIESEKPEFFKLDVIDRKVLLWLLDHVPEKSISAWMSYIAESYQRDKSVTVDPELLWDEVKQSDETRSFQQIL